VILLVVGGLFGTKFLQINNAMQSRKAPPPATVTTTRVITETWQPSISAIGSVTATEGIVLSNEFAGIVSAIHFKSGQAVNKGDLLIELDTSTNKAELKGLLASQKLANLNTKDRLSCSKQNPHLNQALMRLVPFSIKRLQPSIPNKALSTKR